jgi:Gram-negative bacterial TonB protein C-terminal/Protein of unknown function (DUF1573)
MKRLLLFIIWGTVTFLAKGQDVPLVFQELSYDFGDIAINNTLQHTCRFQNTSSKPIKRISLADTAHFRIVEMSSFMIHPIYPLQNGEITLEFIPNKLGIFQKEIPLTYQFVGKTFSVLLSIKGNVLEKMPNAVAATVLHTRGLGNTHKKEAQPLNLAEIQSYIGYPSIARESEIQGLVQIEVFVNEKGQYVNHVVKDTVHSLLLEQVELYIPKMRFSPAVRNNQPIASWLPLSFYFQLDNEGNKYEMKIFCK